MKIVKQKEFKEKEHEESIDWNIYKMKKNYRLVYILIGFLIYFFITLLLLSRFILFSSLKDITSIVMFTLGIFSFVLVVYYAMRLVKYII
jgi:hypothetical protein